MNRYHLFFLPFALICMGSTSTCGGAETKDREAVDRQQQQYQTAQPIPAFDWSLERQSAIELYEARNEEVSTWTVWRGDTSQIEDWCPSVGYPIPYDTSLTNPLKTMYRNSGTGVVEQAEPNGLFSSKNSIATWVRCVVKVNGKTVQAPVYIEGKVTAYAWPIEVDLANNTVTRVEGQSPSVTLSGKK